MLFFFITDSESYSFSLIKAFTIVAMRFSFKLEILPNFTNARIVQLLLRLDKEETACSHRHICVCAPHCTSSSATVDEYLGSS